METDSCIIKETKTTCLPLAERKLGFFRILKNKRKGLPLPPQGALAYSITRFCFGKNTKPEHERDPQVPALAADTPTPP